MQISVSTPMPDDGNCQVIEHLEARPLRARRGWSAEAKARLVEEIGAAGADGADAPFRGKRNRVRRPGAQSITNHLKQRASRRPAR